jgi:hypothetical protein
VQFRQGVDIGFASFVRHSVRNYSLALKPREPPRGWSGFRSRICAASTRTPPS